MKKITIILILIFLSSLSFAQKDGDNSLFGVPKISLGFNSTDSIQVLSGRAVAICYGPNSLDGDNLTDILVTDWNTGRVCVFEQVSTTSLEFKLVWSSAKKKAKANGTIPFAPQNTPKAVTFGDLDGNGKKEVIFPIGYTTSDTVDSDTTWQRGVYVYECIGDNNYGTKPFIIRPESFDPNTKNYSWGRPECSGILAADIDNDGQQELLIGSTTLLFDPDLKKSPAKAYVLSVKSGTFANRDAKVTAEYIYDKMAKAVGDSDGYVPHGFIVADVDGDGKDEVVIAGRTNISYGGAVGFLKASGKDTYIDGNIVDLTKNRLNIFRVTSQMGKYHDNNSGKDVVFIKTDELSGDNRILALQDVIDVGLANIDNFNVIKKGYFGGFTGGAVGDQDHGTGTDGFDFYFPKGNSSGGTGIYDLEYKGSGSLSDSNNYTLTQIFDISKVLKRASETPGLYQIFVPPYDLNNNGRKEIIAGFQSWVFPDTLVNGNVLLKAPLAFFVLEWGDPYIGTVSVKPLVMITDADYKLEQNYPNPFNPTTNIKFSLPTPENISLIVYDMNGREVRKLIDGKLYEKGSYEATWDAKDNYGKPVSTGNYFYKLVWGNFEKSMKMTLLK